MKPSKSWWKAPRPLRTLGELMVAVALSAFVLALVPGNRRPPAGVVPRPAPRVLRVVPTVEAYDPRPADRCLVPAPRLDEPFLVAPAVVDDPRFVVKPMVRGLRVREADPSGGPP